VREIEPKVHYQYLLEDLQSSGFHSAFADTDVIRAATALPDLHKHMETWVSHDDDSLIRYGAAFSADLRRMTRRSFERYTDAVPDRSVVDVLENWESIAQVHSEAIQHEQTLEVPIHGDANRANLLVHDDHDLPLKLVDWEWAGVGLPHSDLASLLKGKRDGVTEEGIRAFAAGYPQLSLAEHRRLHYWARIETRFFDASYMINQYLESPDTSRMDLPRYIHVSAGDIVKTAKRIDS
jgi:thiamine kinase-like enzyme